MENISVTWHREETVLCETMSSSNTDMYQLGPMSCLLADHWIQTTLVFASTMHEDDILTRLQHLPYRHPSLCARLLKCMSPHDATSTLQLHFPPDQGFRVSFGVSSSSLQSFIPQTPTWPMRKSLSAQVTHHLPRLQAIELAASSQPLFHIHAVQLQDGMVLTVSVSHAIADGLASFEICKSLSQLFQQSTKTLKDSRPEATLYLDESEALEARAFGDSCSTEWAFAGNKAGEYKQTMHSKVFHFSAEALQKLKTTASPAELQISTNDALTAYIWKLCNKCEAGIKASGDFFVSMNARPHLHPPIPSSTTGNYFVYVKIPGDHIDPAVALLSEMASRCRRTVQQEAIRMPKHVSKLLSLDRSNLHFNTPAHSLSSVTSLPYEKLIFGDLGAIKELSMESFDRVSSCHIAVPDMRGGQRVIVSLPPEQLAVFEELFALGVFE